MDLRQRDAERWHEDHDRPEGTQDDAASPHRPADARADGELAGILRPGLPVGDELDADHQSPLTHLADVLETRHPFLELRAEKGDLGHEPVDDLLAFKDV